MVQAPVALVAGWLGCVGADPVDAGPVDPSEPSDPGSSPTIPSVPTPPWTAPGATEPPVFDADALGRGLDDVLVAALGLDAAPALDAYDDVMRYASGPCPDPYSYAAYYGMVEAWYAQCETNGGAVYSGYASDYHDDSYDLTTGRGYRGLYAEATVVAPGGETWSGVGYWARGEYGSAGYVDLYLELDGVLEYDAGSVEGTWIGQDIVPSVSIHRTYPADHAWHVIEIDGSFTGLAGEVDTAAFVEVALEGNYGCAEPTGTISLRTPEADWYDLAFSGDPSDPDGCDGCAEARWRGEAVGTVCGDFSPWMTGVTP